MNELFKEKVHVAFLGWEIERIVQPVIKMRATRLILICLPREEEGAWKYLLEIKRILEGEKITVDVIETSLYKMVSLLEILNKIFQVETRLGNEIYINVSAGTKITACASTIASMSTPGITAYYVRTKDYYPRNHMTFPQTLTKGIKEIFALPECQIDVPEGKYIKVLFAIERGEKELGGKVYLKTLIEDLKNMKVINVRPNSDPRKQASSEYMAMNKLLKQLQEWDYINISDKRRNKYITITRKGKDAVKMYLDYELDSKVIEKHHKQSIKEIIQLMDVPGELKLD
ncbi:hypothetical protein GF325_17710 [Candidatus Bathyarchaeota archaeon]|nr:hypothetical protein [Candidatus Bathyarchaeota archaeon]